MSENSISCEYCNKTYKRRGNYINHLSKYHRNEESKSESEQRKNINKNINKKIKKNIKKKIPPKMRQKIWETYIGNTLKSLCFCCHKKNITPFSGVDTFEAGHIISEHNGGEIILGNLLPICGKCNRSMSTMHWDDYINKRDYPLRIYGNKIQLVTQNFVIIIQKNWRRKKIYLFLNKLLSMIREKNIHKSKKSKKRKKCKKKNNKYHKGYLKHTISSINKISQYKDIIE